MKPARFSLLSALENASAPATSTDVAETFGWSRRRAAMALLRAYRTGLLKRQSGRFYLISDKGLKRLSWVRRQSS